MSSLGKLNITLHYFHPEYECFMWIKIKSEFMVHMQLDL